MFELPPIQHITTPRGAMACAISGDGKPVLAIHGSMGGCDQSWILAEALFAGRTGYRLLSVSRPGYPGTPLSVGGTPSEQADAYAAMLDTLGMEQALVAAISGGGPSAIQFAVRHPKRCSGLILVSAATGQIQVSSAMAMRIWMTGAMTKVPGALHFFRQKVERDPAAAAARSIPDRLAVMKMLAHPIAGPLFRQFQQSIFEDTGTRIAATRSDIALLTALPVLPLDRIAQPVLALHGTDDPIVPISHAHAVTTHARNARCVPLAGGGHTALFTHLDEIRTAVGEFVAR